MQRSIRFCYPRRTVPISVTGRACALDCAHCGRRYLAHMIPLQDAATNARVRQAASLLISGGCDADGTVPVASHIPEIAALHSGRRLNWHVGLTEEREVRAIAPHADVVSFDFPGDDATIRQVYGLDRTLHDYVASYLALREQVRVVPHVTLGLRGGAISGEHNALRLLSELGAEELVLLVLIPTRGTRYADRQPPALAQVVELIDEARRRFPSAALTLGCMRPAGGYRERLDLAALEAGVDCIVNPSAPVLERARATGLGISRSEECCVF